MLINSIVLMKNTFFLVLVASYRLKTYVVYNYTITCTVTTIQSITIFGLIAHPRLLIVTKTEVLIVETTSEL